TNPDEAGAAILAWAVEGTRLWRDQGLGSAPAVETATAAYRQAMSPLTDFLGECCVLRPQSWIAAEALRAAYERICRERGDHPITGKEWGAALTAAGCSARTRRGVDGRPARHYFGITLRAAEGQA